jgi:hypothetical protein
VAKAEFALLLGLKRLQQHYCQGYGRFYQTKFTIIDMRFIFISLVHSGVVIKNASKGRKAVISFCYLCLAIINRIKRVQCLTMAKGVLALVLGL